jgi:dienelactone hydrolase
MGNGDYLDIMTGVDEVLRTSPVDSERMALIGYSYGGEMAGFVEGETARFKAIVSGAPVIDQFSEYGTESGSCGDHWYTGQAWRHFESAWRQSPLAYAEHAKTPFMLLEEQSDTTDPEGQSKEMYRALRQEKVPVQLLLFPREDHGALRGNSAGRLSSEPWAGVIAREHMINLSPMRSPATWNRTSRRSSANWNSTTKAPRNHVSWLGVRSVGWLLPKTVGERKRHP